MPCGSRICAFARLLAMHCVSACQVLHICGDVRAPKCIPTMASPVCATTGIRSASSAARPGDSRCSLLKLVTIMSTLHRRRRPRQPWARAQVTRLQPPRQALSPSRTSPRATVQASRCPLLQLNTRNAYLASLMSMATRFRSGSSASRRRSQFLLHTTPQTAQAPSLFQIHSRVLIILDESANHAPTASSDSPTRHCGALAFRAPTRHPPILSCAPTRATRRAQ